MRTPHQNRQIGPQYTLELIQQNMWKDRLFVSLAREYKGVLVVKIL
jgi:hypothetical protein